MTQSCTFRTPGWNGRGLRTTMGALAALLFLAGCDERSEAEDVADLEQMKARIDEMIANRACTGDGACRVIGLGVKPCGGGPWEYKLYSTEHVDTLTLQKAVREYNDLNREANERHGWTSDCSIPVPPNVACYYGTCEVMTP